MLKHRDSIFGGRLLIVHTMLLPARRLNSPSVVNSTNLFYGQAGRRHQAATAPTTTSAKRRF
jgi:hypothetical protein